MKRKQIIKSVRQRYVDRQPLNLSAVKRDAPELVEAVYRVRPYWGWRQALADAGLDYEDIRMEVRETVACQICGRHYISLTNHLLSAHETTADEYREEYPDAELVSESMRERMTGARVARSDYLPHWEPVYTPEYILDRIYEYHLRGYWMEEANIVWIDPALPAAAESYLECSWDEVLRRLGLDPVEVRGLIRDDDFTLEQFRAWLDDRERRGRLNTCVQVIHELDEFGRRPRMFTWALRRFGNWAAALEAAGVDLSRPAYGNHKYTTPESVLNEIKRLHSQGADLSHTGVNLRQHGGLLTSAAVRFFGRWEAALDSADVPAADRGRRTYYRSCREVLAAIRRRLEHGMSVAPLDVYYGTNSDSPLWKKAFKCFGSWRSAVQQAGGSRAQVRQSSSGRFYPTAARVTAELRRRRKAGRLLAKRELTSSEQDKHLYIMAVGFFGSWQGAVTAAGEDPKAYHVKNLQPNRKYLTKQAIVAAIRRRQLEGQPLNSGSVARGDQKDIPLLYAARKLFGDWKGAIEAAGISYDTVVRKQQDYEAMKGRTYHSYDTPEEVVRAIRRRVREKRPVTHRALSQGKVIEDRDHRLVAAGRKFFGDWDAALRGAGIEPADVQAHWVPRRKANLERKKQQANSD